MDLNNRSLVQIAAYRRDDTAVRSTGIVAAVVAAIVAAVIAAVIRATIVGAVEAAASHVDNAG
jgi:hypothetical protein